MFDIRFNHEAKQKSKILPLFGTAPWRVEGDVSHTQLPYLENCLVGDGVVGVLSFPVLEGVLQTEERSSKLDSGKSDGLKPSIQISRSGTDDGPAKSDKDVLREAHITPWQWGFLCLGIVWALFVFWFTCWAPGRRMDSAFTEFMQHMSLPLNKSRYSDGSVNVHWTNGKEQTRREKD